MCYSGCPYEKTNGHPDFRGECTIGRRIPEDAYCYEDETEDGKEIDDD